MPINAASAGAPNVTGAAPLSEPATPESQAGSLKIDALLDAATRGGVDPSQLASLLGQGQMTKLQSTIDALPHAEHGTLQALLDVHRVPAATNWREALANIKNLDESVQGQVLGRLAMRLEHLPDAMEKSLLMDGIVDAMHDLRGQAAVDAMWGFAQGMGAACRADPSFEQIIASRS